MKTAVTFSDGPLQGQTRTFYPARYYEYAEPDPADEFPGSFEEMARRVLNNEPPARLLRHQYENTREGWKYRGCKPVNPRGPA